MLQAICIFFCISCA